MRTPQLQRLHRIAGLSLEDMAAPHSTNGPATPMELNYLQSVLAVQRVKVYRLNDEGRWDDKGTGHVSVEYLERSDALGMVVIDETDNNTLLVHRISADDIYRRQEETIISWTDPEIATDLALSFQEAMGCGFIWEQICNVQRSVSFTSVGAVENGSRIPNDELEHSGTSQDDDDVLHDSGSTEIPELPAVGLSSLPQLVKTIAEVSPPDKDRVASLIVREQSYIHKLMELFRLCEDLENVDALRMLFRIVKGIISLNDRHVFDIIFSDEYIMDIVGALEFDPELPSQQDHRGFLKNQVVFKEAVPIGDSAIVSKIHQTYRIGYIKDVILPRVLDDQTFATLNSLMMANNKAVVSALQADKVFLTELFTKLRAPDVADSVRNDLIFFLHEFCNLSKTLLSYHRTDLFSTLVEKGIFDVITTALQSGDTSLCVSGSDILIVILNHEPALLRNFVVQQPGQVLFSLLVKGTLVHSEGGLQAQILEIMRMLLDSEQQQQQEKILYLDLFYEKYMDQLVEVLTSACPVKGSTDHSKQQRVTVSDKPLTASDKPSVSGEVLGNICELMCFFVLHHGYRMKYYVMRNNVVEKVLRLVRRKEKVLVVAAVRFLRTCVGLKDEFYDRYLVKNKLFEPVIQAFLANGNRYNLLNSAVLELIDFIRKSDLKNLVVHLVENYGEKLEVVDYVDTVRQLKLRYGGYLEGPSAPGREAPAGVSGTEPSSERFIGPFPDLRKRKDERALDKDEEDYFNEDSDDEEDSARAFSTSNQADQSTTVNGNVLEHVNFRPLGLVDYDDEDDDSLVPWGPNGKALVAGRKAEETIVWSAEMAKRRPHHPDMSIQKKQRQEISGGHSEAGSPLHPAEEGKGLQNRILNEGRPHNNIVRTEPASSNNNNNITNNNNNNNDDDGMEERQKETKQQQCSSRSRDDNRSSLQARVSVGSCKLLIETTKPTRVSSTSTSPEPSSSR